jgi:hypothetical protein
MTVQKKAEALSGKRPSKSWVSYFLQHHTEIRLGKPSGLDPKYAQAFNKPTVFKYFDLLMEIVCKFEVSIENVFNMDEKGCKRGGGRNSSNQVYFLHRSQRPKFGARSWICLGSGTPDS